MRRILLLAWCLICVILSFAGGMLLANWFSTLPIEMPFYLGQTIKFGFRIIVQDDMPDPEDIGTVAVLVYFVCSLAIVSVIVAIVGTILWRRVIGRWKSST